MAETIHKPIIEDPRRRPDLRGLENVAWLMDRAIRIPGTNVTVGLDALLGLLPVGGDLLTGLVQVGLVLVALFRFQVPRAVAARMAANVLIDVAVGSIPVLGDLFDVAFKANTRNLRLLNEVQQERTRGLPVAAKPSLGFMILIATGLIALLGLVLVGFITVVSWVVGRLHA